MSKNIYKISTKTLKKDAKNKKMMSLFYFFNHIISLFHIFLTNFAATNK